MWTKSIKKHITTTTFKIYVSIVSVFIKDQLILELSVKIHFKEKIQQ